MHRLLIVALALGLGPRLFAQEDAPPSIDSRLVSSLEFRSIGPAFMSGRIADIAVDPCHPNTWYVAAGSGNLWKTTNAGTTWTPIFDRYASYSMGCVTIDPTDCSTIWVGTGEAVGGRHVSFGDGVYRSRDGGQSFENLGLKHSEHIAKIVIDPRDPDTVLVASQGPLWSPGGERGLFRTEDGGQSWKLVLAAGPYTGVTDVVMDPSDPDVLYAATHQRHRTVAALLNGGPESGIRSEE
ncbi:MAG: glycosyl hydrolase, partial [Planctomycetota bacterium]